MSNVGGIDTAQGARDWALATIGQVASRQGWTAPYISASGLAVATAYNGASDADTFWLRLDAAWDATASQAGFSAPNGWTDLGSVWTGARVARGTKLAEREAGEIWTQISGGYSATRADLTEVASSGATALAWVKAHPWLTVAGAALAVIFWQAAPIVVARVVTR